MNKVPQFWRFDAFASYALPLAEFQLNVANLTDRCITSRPPAPRRCPPRDGWSC